ncbi:unnamed protein product [Fraxinus pennsylvanica]|uniref:DUF4378 domain-containing protein n=1 Tax=Fraxinus pennsylvanica TaxID=56036 RepID=A0AAD2DYL9_9LAMI|nr:unnamed protein product [Fraxinus pennsylvanica]
MGKHFWIRHVDDELEDKQPGCVGGLIHVLDYHHWHSNGRKYEGRRKSKFSAAYGRSKTKFFESGEVEKLLNDQERKFVSAEGNSKEEENGLHKAGFSVPSRLQRTYSIHHLESTEGGLHKILTDWKRPIIFLPDSGTTESLDTSKKAANEMREVYNDQSMNGTESDSLLASNKTVKLSKSKSYPAADLLQRRKFKPSKLEHKKNEIWPFSEGDKLQAFSQSPQLAHLENDIFQRRNETIASGTDEYNIRKSTRIHYRSSSLNESGDKYTSLFASSYGAEVKLHPSRSLKSINEYGHAPIHYRRIRSLSQVDYYYSDHKSGVLGNDFSADGSNTNVEESSSRGDGENEPLDANETTKGQEESVNKHYCKQRIEDEASLRLKVRHEDSSVLDGSAGEIDELTVGESDSHGEQVTNFLEIMPEKLPEERHISDSETSLREMISHPGDFEISEGLDSENDHFYQKNSSVESHDQKSFYMDSSSSFNSTLNLEKSGYADTNNKCFGHGESQKETDSDLYYVRHILEKSGIVENAFDITWHSSDEPLSPELFEEVEAYWNHEQSQLTGWPDFYGCWHHRLLFDLVNEVLIQIYDRSSLYYPKALSSSCHIRPMPVGNRFIEQVSTSIGALLNFKPKENQSLDSIVTYDLANDYSWMNLQLESETVALDLEDMIFDELLEEVMCT